jgi:hypothetical protein
MQVPLVRKQSEDAPSAPARAGRALACAAVLTVAALSGAAASEGGASLFVPGLNVPTAGVLPPPGVFFDNQVYLYSGELSGGRSTALGGNIVAGVKVNLWADFMTGLWVAPADVLGGNLGFSVSVPFGQPTVRAGAILNGPIINRLLGRPLVVGVSDSTLNFGDPVLSSMIGWHAGNWHWKLSAAVSVPAGAYQAGELSNVALNRWIGDFSAGVTYLDPTLGLDLSGSAGFTVNGENPATDYRSGDEFHLDLSISKNLTKEFSLGVIGSYYQQVTGDSGAGATLGAYKGRDIAVGGTLGYNFTIGQTPVSTRVKLLKEIDVENRFKGTIGWLQVSFPLWVDPHAAAAASAEPKL